MKKVITDERPERWGTNFSVLRYTVALALSICIISAAVPSVNAHTIDVVKAREKAREYARTKRSDPNRNYAHYQTDCVAGFPGHNHVVVCAVSFDTAANRAAGSKEWSCSETIEVYFKPHHKTVTINAGSSEMFIRHTSAKEC